MRRGKISSSEKLKYNSICRIIGFFGKKVGSVLEHFSACLGIPKQMKNDFFFVSLFSPKVKGTTDCNLLQSRAHLIPNKKYQQNHSFLNIIFAYILVYISHRYAATLGNITKLCSNLCATTKITSDYAELCGIVRRINVTSLSLDVT